MHKYRPSRSRSRRLSNRWGNDDARRSCGENISKKCAKQNEVNPIWQCLRLMKRNSAANEKMEFRKSGRLDLATPVEIREGASRTMGLTKNVSIGGLLLECCLDFQSGSRLDVLFNLPTGLSVRARCSVVHLQPEARVGLRFLGLEAACHEMLEEFIREMTLHMRQWQHKAIVKRLYIVVMGCKSGAAQEELAETILLSRHGGVLVCRARFKAGQKIFLWSPDRRQGAYARIVSHRLRDTSGLVELGFEFQDTHDLWGIDLLAIPKESEHQTKKDAPEP